MNRRLPAADLGSGANRSEAGIWRRRHELWFSRDAWKLAQFPPFIWPQAKRQFRQAAAKVTEDGKPDFSARLSFLTQLLRLADPILPSHTEYAACAGSMN